MGSPFSAYVLALTEFSSLGGFVRPSAIDEAVRSTLRDRAIPGAAVAVGPVNGPVYSLGYGVRTIGGAPVDAQTRFEIGSDTKQFTAAAILQLKERRALRLDDRLSKYVPGFPHAGELTIRELLNQTSGLPDYVATNHFLHVIQTTSGSLDAIERLASGPLRFGPGTKWEYSNTNYIALGRVVEVASGLSYDRYLHRYLFEPAGMSNTTTIAHERGLTDVATGYWSGLSRSERLKPAPELGESWTGAAGEIVSTAGDLMKWDRALVGGRIIDRADFQLMTSPARLQDGAIDDYGFGWWIDRVLGLRDVYHDGDTIGMSSSNNLFLDNDLIVVVLANRGEDSASHVARAIVKAIR